MNRVSFDAAKEYFVVLHPSAGSGPPFKLLGPLIDTDLRMHSCIDQVMSKVRPKINAILRMRGFYDVPQLLNQFKTHIWSLLEMNAGAIFHAASSLLDRFDKAQNSFLKELDMTSEQAFLEFNFAPPKLTRNIAMLGMLHKRVLGKCHPSFEHLLPWHADRFPESTGSGHSKRLYGHWCEATAHPVLFAKSIFCFIDVYNNLTQNVVDASCVSEFQAYLTQVARTRCQLHDTEWASSFCRRCEHYVRSTGHF